MLMSYFDRFASDYTPYKGGAWCYEDGILYRGLAMLHMATGDARWLDHLRRLADVQIGDGTSLLGYDATQFNIDNIQPGRALLYLHAQTGQARYLQAAHLLAAQLAEQPRTRSGVYWHKQRYPWQVWLDGLYMGPPFQIEYARVTDQPALREDSLKQISTALDMTINASGLYVHACDEACQQPWANAETGHSAAVWSRAVGWLAMSLVDIAELVGPDSAEFSGLRQRTTDLLDRTADLRRPGGMWLQVMDRPDLDGNYEEASASAMFTYALQKGRTLGLTTAKTDGLHDQLIKSFFQIGPDGEPYFCDVCEVAGLGMYEDRFRDGSPEYYLTEQRVADEVKGVAPLMMSAAIAHAQQLSGVEV